MKMSQFREGTLGRLESHDWGIPVYLRAAFMPDSWARGGAGVAPLEDIGLDTSRTSLRLEFSSVAEAASEDIFDHVPSGSGKVLRSRLPASRPLSRSDPDGTRASLKSRSMDLLESSLRA